MSFDIKPRDRKLNLLEIIKRYTISVEGLGLILCLHRVSLKKKDSLNSSLFVDIDHLNLVIDTFLKSGYSFISFDAFVKEIEQKSNAKKIITITFDDGYKDNFDIALPYFESKKIPFLIYLTTSFLDGTAQLWWFALEAYLDSEGEKVDPAGNKYTGLSLNQKLHLFLSWREQILKSTESKENAFKQLFGNLDWISLNRQLALSWEDTCVMQKSNLVSFGSHTINHPNLAECSEEEVRKELSLSKSYLEKKLETSISHFCYPYGSRNECGQREFGIAREVGYKTATTTRFGNIFPEHKSLLFSLPRVSITSDFTIKEYRKNLLRRFMRGSIISQ
ncbi:hypothetical protein EHQ58_08475 [Leptospira ognonensis]|uniref:NodB homology domain-containing protein n=1 Tax=Leptospira ognonensis TaxID=2484945 RepID=A0A4R9K3N2_9LEPT|nr:polysaccharide deacetylase family protein [Leptospira ognonensis]TGL59766.1 hypothetical protein EHQ58_08475 [Leptospira ognonensis]